MGNGSAKWAAIRASDRHIGGARFNARLKRKKHPDGPPPVTFLGRNGPPVITTLPPRRTCSPWCPTDCRACGDIIEARNV